MNEDLWQAITGKEPLSKKELNSKRIEMMGLGWDELDEEWENMVKFSYNIAQYDEVLSVEELGATTSIVIVVLDISDVKEPNIVDKELLKSMASQTNYVGEIARYVTHEEDVALAGAKAPEDRDGTVEVDVWT